MDSLKLFVLALVQGITELLPISSSGHILLLGNVINLPVTTTLLTFLHIGTTLSILFYFRKTVREEFLSKNNRENILKILLGSIPAIIVGVFFEEYITEKLRDPWITALSLIAWGMVMIALERKNTKDISISKISFRDSFVIGLSQCMALIPGTSRSGITTITGVLLGIEKYTAFKFSLLLGIPILLGSSVWSLSKELLLNGYSTTIDTLGGFSTSLIIISVSSMIGYLSILVVERFKKNNWLTLFGIYRIVVGILIILLQYGS
jgi:undecaprenyl-diphosphatase